ncbi:MAG TPA: SRPBCC domain-containing protein, partial [Burkholderiaceae bacterium]|nr:SRPBCC domain-containing protein [Burkholderiaceae bacterium]
GRVRCAGCSTVVASGCLQEKWMRLAPTIGNLLTILCGLAIALSAPAPSAAERSIDKEVVIDGAVDEVWEAWTTRAGVVSFFAPDAEVDARVGGAFHIYFDPLAQSGFKGADDMRFLALQPKKMLSFDWNAPPHLPEARQQRTFVVVRLHPVGEKQTRVSLHHTGWGEGGEWDKAFAYFDRAWIAVLANLKRRFEKGPIDWTEWMTRLREAHEKAAAQKSN